MLANDHGRPLQIVSHADPAHGSLTFQPDGSLEYVPQAGFTGDDTFTYTVTNAVLRQEIPLRDSAGHPYSGRGGTQNPNGETIEDLSGHVLAQDPDGYDSEGQAQPGHGRAGQRGVPGHRHQQAARRHQHRDGDHPRHELARDDSGRSAPSTYPSEGELVTDG